MKSNYKISFNQDISDPLAMGKPDKVSDVLKTAEKTVTAGKKVAVILDHAAPDAVMAVYQTPAEIQAWRSRLNDLQQSRGQHLLD